MKWVTYLAVFILLAMFSIGCTAKEPMPIQQHPGGAECLEEDLSPSKERECHRAIWGP